MSFLFCHIKTLFQIINIIQFCFTIKMPVSKNALVPLPKINQNEAVEKLTKLRSQLIRPLTKETAFYHYLPMFGVKSYLELSLNVFNPVASMRFYRR